MGKKSGSESGMDDPGSYFQEFRTNFWVILKFFYADPGWIRDNHPGSAALIHIRNTDELGTSYNCHKKSESAKIKENLKGRMSRDLIPVW
jgi:hypothetical protein